jgi:hypothetical protein
MKLSLGILYQIFHKKENRNILFILHFYIFIVVYKHNLNFLLKAGFRITLRFGETPKPRIRFRRIFLFKFNIL